MGKHVKRTVRRLGIQSKHDERVLVVGRVRDILSIFWRHRSWTMGHRLVLVRVISPAHGSCVHSDGGLVPA